ncbi:hypothetical protein [Paraburkholderia megapolitana]|uniref:hypothetical protein n=1 Tax=Paraburkholderia megapolitana TaxID=420953 RepID=UPI0038B7D4E0
MKTTEQVLHEARQALRDATPKRFRDHVEEQQFADIQARADRVFQASAKAIPAPGDESAVEYRVRLLRSLQSETTLARTDLSAVAADAAMLEKIERRVYDEAMATAHRSPTLREIKTETATGTVSEFVGAKRSWMGAFSSPAIISPICVDGVPQSVPTIVS